ncbi:hypothetical protein C2869_12335 [Saccharobesus litoralis]|uniref:Uncharacterized protein n=1 Tax=Saccharobesus litoralis TaxID=2172099 RepID=A0A2S0VSI6_9ALTE|nr:hypothetical protein C2869_06115 [Saccharobesus litoralis]AWB67174.1 hypothetical protein C2869_12335 [Saccharobesus litoralis]
MADEPVVVIKPRPMKASNGVEDKTKATISEESNGICQYQKYDKWRRGEVFFKGIESTIFFFCRGS